MSIGVPIWMERRRTVLRQIRFEIETAWTRWRQRRHLLTLDDRMLKDMGINRCDAVREAAKGWRR